MVKLFRWLDENLFAVLAGFLLVFIPLYPKWPLFDILYGYNVRVRLEDFFVLFSAVMFVIWVIRRKIKPVFGPTLVGMLIYLTIGFLSTVTAIFIIQTVPLQYLHVAKTVLHWGRRIEYFSLFLVFFAAIRSIKITKILTFLFFVTLLGVIIYGFGQKYLYWPAFSTMNREFAKGWWLYLTEHARVLSTFGGHYDLAAYLVIALPLGWSFYFGTTKRWVKLGLIPLLAGGFWLLILTASRSSFVAYILGISIVVFLWTFRKGFTWGVSRWIVVTGLSILVMLSFGDLSDRFLHLLKLDQRVAAIREIVLKPAGAKPQNNAVFLENNIAAVTSKSDQPPTPGRPPDVNPNDNSIPIEVRTASGASELVARPRTYSQNALMYDLSTGIRLDTTWPKAIAGFKADPLLGSGYATLSKANKYDYTEAESTDNDYLRALGETGALGAISFFGTVIIMAFIAFRSLGGIRDGFLYSLTAGFVAIVLGLLANATLVDIFEASKVAYVFWGVSGMTMATLYAQRNQIRADRQPMRITIPWREYLRNLLKFLRSDLFWVGLVVIVAFWLRLYKFDAPIADWHSWRQADTSAVTRNFIAYKQINWLYPTYYDISSVQSGRPNPLGLRMVEFPLYNAATVLVADLMPEITTEAAGRMTTALFFSMGLVFLFLLVRKTISRRAAYVTAIVYALMPFMIFYGRTVLPDPAMVATALGATFFAAEFLDQGKKRNLILAFLFEAASLLMKPMAIFLLLPIGYFALVNRSQRKRIIVLGLVLILGIGPLLWWRWWISHFPEGIPASDWLFNGDGIRFKGAFWYWLFADRIGRLILGYWGLLLLGFGLLRKETGKYSLFPLVLFLTSIVYLFVFATGNVRHDYYQILITSAIAALAGVGLDFLLFGRAQWLNGYVAKLLGIISFAFMIGFGWYFIRDYYNINHPEIVEAGQKLEQMSNWKALVIAPYDGDTAFLYQTHRQGWPVVEGTIDDMIKKGADYYVSVKFDDLTKKLMANAWPVWMVKPETNHKYYPYKMLDLTDKYVIIQLVPDKDLPKG